MHRVCGLILPDRRINPQTRCMFRQHSHFCQIVPGVGGVVLPRPPRRPAFPRHRSPGPSILVVVRGPEQCAIPLLLSHSCRETFAMKCRFLLTLVLLPSLAASSPAGIIFGGKKPTKPPTERVPELINIALTSGDENKRSEAVEELRQFDTGQF